MAYFHCSSTPLQAGSVIEPGNWGRIVRKTGWQHTHALRELAFDEIRRRDFPSKPSRLDSIFFFDNENEAVFYANSDGRQTTMITYEVAVLNEAAPKHAADWRLATLRAEYALDLSWISKYWNSEMLPMHGDALWDAQCKEILAVTPLRIIRRIEFARTKISRLLL